MTSQISDNMSTLSVEDAIRLLSANRKVPKWVPFSSRLSKLLGPDGLTLDQIAEKLAAGGLVRIEDSRRAASFLIDMGRNGLSNRYRVIEYKDVRSDRIGYQFYQL